MKQATNIFRKGSTTYFFSSLFFPPHVRDDVTTLYAFVRTADDYVDAIPAQKKAFFDFTRTYTHAYTQVDNGNSVIAHFVELTKRKHIPPEWTHAFLQAMKQDLTKKTYVTIEETIAYMYGSAEVIGLMMAKIMDLPPHAYHSAQMLGRAMQYINFIRDIQEDITLGRQYIPSQELYKAHLPQLTSQMAHDYPIEFRALITDQISLYRTWLTEAEKGFHFIPKRYRIAIQTASDMYTWTAEQIQKDPYIIFEKKVKPHPLRVIAKALWNTLYLALA